MPSNEVNSICFCAHLKTEQDENLTFSLVTSYEKGVPKVCWSLSGDRENLLLLESYTTTYSDLSETCDKLAELDSKLLSSKTPQTCDYIVEGIKLSVDSCYVPSKCNVKLSYPFESKLHVKSANNTSLMIRFSHQESDVTSLDGNNFCSVAISGTIDILGSYEVKCGGNGWISKSSLFSTSANKLGRPGFVMFGTLSSGEHLLVSCNPINGPLTELTGYYCLKGTDGSYSSGSANISVTESWISSATFQSFPISIVINIPKLKFLITVTTRVCNKEICSIFSQCSGQVTSCFDGSVNTTEIDRISINGTIVCFGAQNLTIESMMANIGGEVKKELIKSFTADIISRREKQIFNAVYSPIKILVDREGKSWRSFLFCAICNLWGKNKYDCVKFSQAIELLHVGSLIIDDIEDHSSIRRGGPAVHCLVETPLAINSGCACFFSALRFAGVDSLPPSQSLQIYQLAFETLRKGHIGQGLDIYGCEELVLRALETEDFSELLELETYIYSMKSGELVSFIGNFACIISDVPTDVRHAISTFGRNLGVAFQIIDDALGLSSTKSKKTFAEDLRNGKFVYPTIKTLQCLTKPRRIELFEKIKAKPSLPEEIQAVLDIISSTNALSQSKKEARIILADSWKSVEPYLPNNIQKKYIFELCQYILRQTY